MFGRLVGSVFHLTVGVALVPTTFGLSVPLSMVKTRTIWGSSPQEPLQRRFNKQKVARAKARKRRK
jgi:hypothetical protein